LCGVILFMAIYGRPDMPSQMLGIPGLNPFNVLLLNVTLAWFAKRREEKRRWDMPGYVNVLLILYAIVVLVATARMLADPEQLRMSTKEMVIEYLLNTFKWVVPALLVFDGCRSRERFYLTLLAILGLYALLALQCARKVMPSPSVDELERRSRKIMEKEIGYHRTDLATMLAGAAWAMFSTRELFRRHRYRMALLAATGLSFYGLLLTGGRAGYASFVIVGLLMCAVRWKRYLAAAPIVALVLAVAFPSVVGRALEGINLRPSVLTGQDSVNEDAVLAGRETIWKPVIAKIEQDPFIGFGRQAHMRFGLGAAAAHLGEESAGNPHSAYLEFILDSGVLGLLPVLVFFGVVALHSFNLFRDSRSPISIAAGGTALALSLAWMGGSLTAQSFYPRESGVGLWCALMLAFRVSIERSRVLARDRGVGRVPRRRQRPALSRPAPVVESPPAPVPIGAYARRRPRVRERWDVALVAEPPSPLDSQLWAKSPPGRIGGNRVA
jgi:O-antigen ligase